MASASAADRVISTSGQGHQPEGVWNTVRGMGDVGVHVEEGSGAGQKPAELRIFVKLFTSGIQHFPEPAKHRNSEENALAISGAADLD
eukprot:14325574-Alexandrium_andersonii.AAC.1